MILEKIRGIKGKKKQFSARKWVKNEEKSYFRGEKLKFYCKIDIKNNFGAEKSAFFHQIKAKITFLSIKSIKNRKKDKFSVKK